MAGALSLAACAPRALDPGKPVDETPAVQMMGWSPELGAYIALRSRNHVFWYGGSYYHYRSGAWLIGSRFDGPWRPVSRRFVPVPLRDFREERWGSLQKSALAHFQNPPENAVHKPFRAVESPPREAR